jgi:Zn-finger nucleic acid-binding protein
MEVPPVISASILPALRCPKCAASMRAVERSRIVIDVCTECRGVYLDRGELERLIDADSRSWEEAERSRLELREPAPYPPRGFDRDADDDDDDDGWRHAPRHDRGLRDDRRRSPRRRGFLAELLEHLDD